jgi:hypothetical protein
MAHMIFAIFFKMEDDLNMFENQRRPPFCFEMLDDLNFLKMEDDSIFLKMEDCLIKKEKE